MLKLFVLLLLFFAGWMGTACATAPTAEPATQAAVAPTLTPSATMRPLPTATATITATVPPTGTPSPTTPPTAVPTATPTPLPFTLAGLRTADFSGGTITINEVQAETAAFTRTAVSYPAEGLTITGQMHTPAGPGPFPVVILLHGYLDRDRYWTGWGTWQTAEFLARNGYITIAPDLRSWGGSDNGRSLFQTGFVRDVRALIAALDSLPQADAERVGVWGHSMGGGIATKVALTDGRVDAAVLYAPNSADDADLLARWGPGCRPAQMETAAAPCNGSEIILPDTPPDLIEAYFAAVDDPERLTAVAPIYHLDEMSVPVQIHIGTEDGRDLSGTPPEWSAKLATGLESAGREVAYFVYEGEGHFFEGANWTLMMSRALALYDRTLKDSE